MNNQMLRPAAIACCMLLAAPPAARAADPEPAPTPAWTATANVNLVSDYRFRGIDQTWGRPAVQGGADLTHASGFYAGVWASNVSGNVYPGGNLEFDYYGGYNGKINDDFSFTVGGYGYAYPGANVDKAACGSAAYPAPCNLPSQSFGTFEVNGGITWKWISYKLSISATDYFGANTSTGYSSGTHGSLYHDLTVTVPLPDDWSIAGHVGRTDVKAMFGTVNPDYTDWRLTAAKTFQGGWNASLAVVGATNSAFWSPPTGGLSAANSDTRQLNKTTAVVQVGRSF